MQAVEISNRKAIEIPHNTIQHKDYPVYVGCGILQIAGQLLHQVSKVSRVVVLADPNAMKYHGEKLFSALGEYCFIHAMILPEGEAHKNMDTVMKILNFLSEEGIQRDDLIIAFGGGVTGDLAGFAASIYMRGIDYIHIPTTLLAQVDSSIGGKVGVNSPSGKNLVGQFHSPLMVLTDPSVLETLPKTQWDNGISELIKYGYTLDATLLEDMPSQVEESRDPSAWQGAIEKAIAIKVAIVEEDPKEQSKRKVLNFGHTLGHGLEHLLGYGTISHGKAVALGMIAETAFAQRELGGDIALLNHLQDTLSKYELDTWPEGLKHSKETWAKTLRADKKNSQKGIDLIWPSAVGQWHSEKIDPQQLAAFAEGVWA